MSSTLHNDGYEKALLGCLILDNAVASELCHRRGITSDTFYLQRNRYVFDAIQSLSSRHEGVDLLQVHKEVKAHGHLDDVGGYGAIDRIIDQTPTVANVEFYITHVRELWLRRRICNNSEVAKIVAADLSVDIHDVVAKYQGLSLEVNSQSEYADKFAHWEAVMKEWRDAAHGKTVGIPSPWTRFDKQTGGPRRGQVTLLASKKGWGKSTLVANWIYHLGKLGIPAADLAFEDGPKITWGRLAANAGSFSAWRRGIGKSTEEELQHADAVGREILQLPIYIEGHRGMSVEAISAWVTRAKAKYGIQAVFIDGFKDILRQGKESLEEDARISSRLCDMAERLDIATIVVHHIRKSGGFGQEDGRDQGKTDFKVEDIRGNGRIVDDARMVLILQVEPFRLDCIRSNNSPTGYVELDFCGEFHRFTEKTSDPIYGEMAQRAQEIYNK